MIRKPLKFWFVWKGNLMKKSEIRQRERIEDKAKRTIKLLENYVKSNK